MRLAAAYTAAVFALGFVLGVVRTLWLLPRFGALAAVAVELPLMLAASWGLCARVVRPARLSWGQRLMVGGSALALLMLAELGVSVGLMGRDLAAHWASYGRPEAQLGLAGQLLFAAFPALQGAMKRTEIEQ